MVKTDSRYRYRPVNRSTDKKIFRRLLGQGLKMGISLRFSACPGLNGCKYLNRYINILEIIKINAQIAPDITL
jgi:hypothetical protein